jgi:hypothetical protein
MFCFRRSSPLLDVRLVTVLVLPLFFTSLALPAGDRLESIPVDLIGYPEVLPPAFSEVNTEGINLVETAAGVAEYLSEAVRSPFPFNAVGIRFFSDIEDPGAIRLHVRMGNDSGGWGEEFSLPLEEVRSPEHATGAVAAGRLLATDLLFRAAADGSAVRIRIAINSPPSGDTTITGLRAVFIDSTKGPTELEILEKMMAREECLPPPSGGGRSRDGYPKPSVVSRNSWGADPAQGTLYYHTVTHLCLHHTAGSHEWNSSGFSQCAANVRATQDYHMNLGWADIGYNYLVCRHGLIWEGRQGGDDVVGAHDAHNWGSMGVSGMGYFHPPYNHVPTGAILDSLADLFAWKCDQRNIDPLGSGWYYGYGGNMETIYGHRQVGATACPGDELQSRLPAIKADVDARLNGGGWSAVFDTEAALTTGSWVTGTMASDKYGSNYLWNNTLPGGREAAGWRFSVPQSGSYRASVWWSQGSNRTREAWFFVKKGGYLLSKQNQQANGGQWNSIGTYFFVAGRTYLLGVVNDSPSGYVVICDAARIEQL